MLTWLLILGGSMLVFSALLLALYAVDKRRARTGGWRVPEARLHLLALLGGWPGAWVGRRWLRHKSLKTRFVLVFWLTVIGHVALAAGISWLVWQVSG